MAFQPVDFAQLASQPNASTAAPTPTPETGLKGFWDNDIVNPVKSAFSGGVNQIQQGASEIGQGEGVLPAVGSALKIGAGVAGAAMSPLAPVFNPTVGAATNAVANKISDNPSVQNFAMSPAGQTTAKVTEGLTNAGTVAGGILGAGAVGEGASNIWDKAYNRSSAPNTLDNAVADREAVAPKAVAGSNDIKNQTSDYKDTLGSTFQKIIADAHAANPTAVYNVPSEVMSQLADIKSTARYAIPQEILDKIPDISKIESNTAGSLNMPETQKLIAQLNKAAGTVNAAGDYVTNQKFLSLANAVKDGAADAFGSIKDANGDSVWVKAYQDYSQGRGALKDFSQALNFKKDISDQQSNVILNRIQKMSQTPEGMLNIKNAINDFKTESGIDLTNPAQAIQQILEKDEAVNGAQKTLAQRKALMNKIKYVAGIGTLGYLFHREVGNVLNKLP